MVDTQEIRTAISAGDRDRDRARLLIKQAMREEPSAELYYLASRVTNKRSMRWKLLRQAQRLDPFDVEVEAALERLQGTYSQSSGVVSVAGEGHQDTFGMTFEEIIGKSDRKTPTIPRGTKHYPRAGIGVRGISYLIDAMISIGVFIVILFTLATIFVYEPPSKSSYNPYNWYLDYYADRDQLIVNVLLLWFVFSSVYYSS